MPETEEAGADCNPYALALPHTGPMLLKPAAAERACRGLIAAYAKDQGHVDWSDVQEALGHAMEAFGMRVAEDGRSVLLLPASGPNAKPARELEPIRPPPPPLGHPFLDGGAWYWLDRDGDRSGPFRTAAVAHMAIVIYLLYDEGGPEAIEAEAMAAVRKEALGGLASYG